MKSLLSESGFSWRRRHSRAAGFSLIELLTAAVVFVILGVLIAQLLSSATLITGLSNKKQVADAQARMIFSRMALDFTKMLNRPDIEYYLQKQSGNDRLAFLAEVAGYYPATATPGTMSVVSYRMGNGDGEYKGLERFSRGLAWLTDATGASSVVYHRPIGTISPEAVSSDQLEDYEEIGPGVLRFEFYYLLKSGVLSEIPWDAAAGHTAVEGFRDVAAICVTLAVVDPAVLARVTADEMRTLAGKFADFSAASMPSLGDLDRQWQQAVDSDSFVKKSGGSVRILSRCFPIGS